MVKCECENCECDEKCPCFKRNGTKKKLKKAAIIAGTTAGVGVASFFAVPLVVAGIGFTAGGVAAGSTEASIMSNLGKITNSIKLLILQ